MQKRHVGFQVILSQHRKATEGHYRFHCIEADFGTRAELADTVFVLVLKYREGDVFALWCCVDIVYRTAREIL